MVVVTDGRKHVGVITGSNRDLTPLILLFDFIRVWLCRCLMVRWRKGTMAKQGHRTL